MKSRREYDYPKIDRTWPKGPAITCNGINRHKFGPETRHMLLITTQADMALAIDEHTKELGPYYAEKRCSNCGYEQRRYSLPAKTNAQLIDEYRRGTDSGGD